VSRDLRRIAAPTLVAWGDRDAMTASQQAALVASIPGARMLVTEGAGHAPHWEEPARYARLIASFASRLQAPAACA
jgi:pimeloyl-ACP methyl ester carboxylesterase